MEGWAGSGGPSHLRQRLAKQREVRAVGGARRHVDVEVGRALAEREVLAAVHREREDVRLVGEDGRGAVALVHVEVDDRHAAHAALAPRPRGRDGQVVEDREARAVAAVRVVRAARAVAREAVPQRQLRRQHRSGHLQLRPLDELRLGDLATEADAARGVGVQAAVDERAVVRLVVDGGEGAGGQRRRLVDQRGLKPPLPLQDAVEVLELPHREAVCARPWAGVARVVDERRRVDADESRCHVARSAGGGIMHSTGSFCERHRKFWDGQLVGNFTLCFGSKFRAAARPCRRRRRPGSSGGRPCSVCSSRLRRSCCSGGGPQPRR